MKDEAGNHRNCLVIVIAQTKGVISVKDNIGKFSCPIRLETGLSRRDYDELAKSKTHVLHDNYDFMLNLKTFLHDG